MQWGIRLTGRSRDETRESSLDVGGVAQVSSLTRAYCYTPSVSPFQQGNEKFSADTEPIPYLSRNDGPLPPQLLDDDGEVIQRFPRVIAIALYGFHPAPVCRQPEQRQEIPFAERAFQLRD